MIYEELDVETQQIVNAILSIDKSYYYKSTTINYLCHQIDSNCIGFQSEEEFNDWLLNKIINNLSTLMKIEVNLRGDPNYLRNLVPYHVETILLKLIDIKQNKSRAHYNNAYSICTAITRNKFRVDPPIQLSVEEIDHICNLLNTNTLNWLDKLIDLTPNDDTLTNNVIKLVAMWGTNESYFIELIANIINDLDNPQQSRVLNDITVKNPIHILDRLLVLYPTLYTNTDLESRIRYGLIESNLLPLLDDFMCVSLFRQPSYKLDYSYVFQNEPILFGYLDLVLKSNSDRLIDLPHDNIISNPESVGQLTYAITNGIINEERLKVFEENMRNTPVNLTTPVQQFTSYLLLTVKENRLSQRRQKMSLIIEYH